MMKISRKVDIVLSEVKFLRLRKKKISGSSMFSSLLITAAESVFTFSALGPTTTR